MNGRSNDRASLCDEFINPLYASVPGCTDPNRGSATGWKVTYAGAVGFLANVSIGYHLTSMIRLELEFATWHVRYDDAGFVGSAVGDNDAKLRQEIFLAREWLGSVSSRAGLVNVYFDKALSRRSITLYVGAGAGMAVTGAGYSSLWARNRDPDAIKTGSDQPNADEIRENLAGTFSAGEAVLLSATPAVQFMAGGEQQLSENIALGLKFSYTMYMNFDSADLVWDPLRSHEPNIRKDGSEPVNGFYSTSDFSSAKVTFQIRHRF